MIDNKLSIVQKICLAGILIVLVALFQKVFAVNYIPIVPFLRISFGGPALIIFSSLLLGPWFGMLVGAASDLLGFFIFDPKTMGGIPFFQITAIYALLGLSAYFVFKLVNKIKKERIMLIIEAGTFMAMYIGIVAFIWSQNSIALYGQTYEFNLTSRLVVTIITFILLALLITIIVLISRHFKKKGVDTSTYHISFASFILEISVMLIFGSIMKAWAFSSTLWSTIFFAQLIVSFINVPLNTFLLTYLTNVGKHFLGGKYA